MFELVFIIDFMKDSQPYADESILLAVLRKPADEPVVLASLENGLAMI